MAAQGGEMKIDPVAAQMDVIAHCLEGLGYGVEVLYQEAKIIVWLEEWPVLIEGRRRQVEGSGQRPTAIAASNEQAEKEEV
jgi:hypothetical protein